MGRKPGHLGRACHHKFATWREAGAVGGAFGGFKDRRGSCVLEPGQGGGEVVAQRVPDLSVRVIRCPRVRIDCAPLDRAAHHRAAVRRSYDGAKALYPNHWRETFNLSAMSNQSPCRGGGPAMRGGASRLDSAQGAMSAPSRILPARDPRSEGQLSQIGIKGIGSAPGLNKAITSRTP
jgi:hypothetical protein